MKKMAIGHQGKGKFYVFLFLITSISLLYSCNRKELLPRNDFGSIAEKNIRIVPVEVARKVAETFDPETFLKATKKPVEIPVPDRAGGLNLIKDIVVIPDHAGIPAIYGFNFANNKGYVMVAADSGMRTILAYVPTGQMEKGNAPGGLVMWLNKTIHNVELVRKGLYDNKKAAEISWKSYAATHKTEPQFKSLSSGGHTNDVPPPDESDPCIANPNYSDVITTGVGSLVPVQWGQWDTYNEQLGYGGCSWNGNYPTGCVATAMAQVARYWQSPTYNYSHSTAYNWTSMPSTSGNQNVQYLMQDAGTSVSMTYACAGSHPPSETYIPGPTTWLWNTKTVTHVANGFKSVYFGFSNATGDWYDGSSGYLTIKSELDNYRPVILTGYPSFNSYWHYPDADGHVWVCDGYEEDRIIYCIDNTSQSTTYLYFHMNWGWQEAGYSTSGNHNGWFAYDNWYISATGVNYQYCNEIAYDIHP